RADAALDGHEDLPARPQGTVAGLQLQRGQSPRVCRQGILFHFRRRLPDADQEGPAAAGSAVFQEDTEVRHARNGRRLRRGVSEAVTRRGVAGYASLARPTGPTVAIQAVG